MKFQEFIELYRKMDDSLWKKLEVRQYVPLREKLVMAFSVVSHMNSLIGNDIQTISYIELQETLRFFVILKLYTNIEMEDEEYTIENYDICQELGVEKLIVRSGNAFDVKKFEQIFDRMTQVDTTLLMKKVLLDQDINKLAEESNRMIDDLEKNGEVVQRLIELFTPQKPKEG